MVLERSKHGWDVKKDHPVKYLRTLLINKHVLKFSGTVIFKVFFPSYIRIVLKYSFVQIWTSLEISSKSWEKTKIDTSFHWMKNVQRFIRMCAQLILTQFFVSNILGVNMYKTCKSYKNIVLCMSKVQKNENFAHWSIKIKHGPHWI
jgi:hypothetical protein